MLVSLLGGGSPNRPARGRTLDRAAYTDQAMRHKLINTTREVHAMMTSLPQVYLARHGETEWSLSGQHTGRTDIPLTPKGEENARKLRPRMTGLTFACVFTSPLQRARRTAEFAGFGDRAEIEPDLAEWDYGAYEGLRTREIRSTRPDWDLFRDGCPGGESIEQITERADRVVARLREVNDDVVVFSHGHILRFLAARWLGLPGPDARLLMLSTASLSILSYEHGPADPALRLWNDDHHLRS